MAKKRRKDKPSLFGRILGGIERAGNRLPHPITLFALFTLGIILVSALFMLLFTWLSKRPRLKWIESFSLSVSMIFGMASAVGYSWLEARLLAMFQ